MGIGEFGTHDMAGNVWEWCIDEWHKEAHLHRQDVDPVVQSGSDVRPLRGGCWRSIEPKLQNAYRKLDNNEQQDCYGSGRPCASTCVNVA